MGWASARRAGARRCSGRNWRRGRCPGWMVVPSSVPGRKRRRPECGISGRRRRL